MVRVALAGGAALLGGSAAAPAAARTAVGPAESDLAAVRLLASGELLAEAFYKNAIRSKRLSMTELAKVQRALAHERVHYTALAKLLGDTAPVADDFEFAFPRDAFTRRERMLRMGTAIETAVAGTYASAAASASTLELRALLAQVAVCEAGHLAALNDMRGGAPGRSFPELFDIEQASAALGPFFGE